MKKIVILILSAWVVQTSFAYETFQLAETSIPAYAQHANPNGEAGSPTEEDAIYINSDLKVVPHVRHEDDPFLHYSIEVTYPQIIGYQLTSEAQQFNQAITQLVDAQVQQFKTNVTKDTTHMQPLPAEAQRNTFKIDYDIDVIHPENLSLVSVRLAIEGMQAGHAHPFHAHEVLNFDLTHGKELVLQDLFKSNTDYLNIIAIYSHAKLTTMLHNQDKWMIAEGTKPTPKNFRNWNLEDDALLITFDEYQVAPYTAGPQEVEIPYSELKNILSPKSPVISMSDKPNKAIG